MNERKELIARLRECHATTHTRAIIDAAADMLEADVQPDVPEVGFGNMPAAPQEPCWCDKNNIGEPGVSCGDCPTRDYAALRLGRPVKFQRSTANADR